MTPTPPSSPDGSSLPPRHRPSLGNLSQDTTESDLWSFEDDLDLPDAVEKPQAEEMPKLSSKDIPGPREIQPRRLRDVDELQVATAPAGGEERIRMNINKVRAASAPSGPTTGHSKPGREFDDLEHWEDAKVEPENDDLPAGVASLGIAAMPAPKSPLVTPQPEKTTPEILLSGVPQPGSDDEFAPPVARENAKRVSLLPHLSLSKVERIGLLALVLILLAGGIAILVVSLNRLPTGPQRAGANDFPIKGGKLTVTSAVSYWRTPITEGPAADTVRRDTKLLPVLEVAVNGGPAAIRVLFRNDERTVVGDAVTRAVTSSGTLKIPATAGFDDLGMHAAYRTGESKPWTVEVFEAPSADTPGKEFKKLFEMTISTDRR